METIQLEHVPMTHNIHLAFFKNVTNAEFLQSRLVARDSKFEFAFIDASTVGAALERHAHDGCAH
jgi:EKC/KEOPS complex subunit CGI121/TPRKB